LGINVAHALLYFCCTVLNKTADMEKININDIIFATAVIRGSVKASLRLSGLNSMPEVTKAVKREIGNFSGLLTISMRNMTQGWTKQKSLYVSPTRSMRQPSGVQLSLF